MSSVAERLAQARARLEAAGVPPADAGLDAEVLARHALGWDRATLITRARDPEPEGFAGSFAVLVARRESREPVAQIVGSREFWGLDFEVTRDVLIPRPETEIIIEEALEFARGSRCETVVDVGTGSGCLGVTIACELRGVHVAAIDLSPAALSVARRNAERHGVLDRTTFLLGSVLEPFGGTADLIVSNPPYVAETDAASLPPDVAEYEPASALFGGTDGLDVIRMLFAQARQRLAAGGRLVVEFGFGQDARVQQLARDAGWTVVRVRDDLQGIPRTIVLSRNAHV